MERLREAYIASNGLILVRRKDKFFNVYMDSTLVAGQLDKRQIAHDLWSLHVDAFNEYSKYIEDKSRDVDS